MPSGAVLRAYLTGHGSHALGGPVFLLKIGSEFLLGPKGAYRRDFCNPDPAKNVHDQGEVTLTNGAKTSIWIGVDPNHSEADVKEALQAGTIGKLEFTITKQNGWKAKSSRFVKAL